MESLPTNNAENLDAVHTSIRLQCTMNTSLLFFFFFFFFISNNSTYKYGIYSLSLFHFKCIILQVSNAHPRMHHIMMTRISLEVSCIYKAYDMAFNFTILCTLSLELFKLTLHHDHHRPELLLDARTYRLDPYFQSRRNPSNQNLQFQRPYHRAILHE